MANYIGQIPNWSISGINLHAFICKYMHESKPRGNELKEQQPQNGKTQFDILPSLWLDTAQVAKLIGVTTRTIQNYRDSGILPYSQIGRVIRYRAQDVQDFLMQHFVKPEYWKGGIL